LVYLFFFHDDGKGGRLQDHCISTNRKDYNLVLCPNNKKPGSLPFIPNLNVIMGKQPSIDRSILIPIALSVFSIFGIFIALAVVYLDKPQAVVPVGQTATPFKYIFLGTETRVPDPELATTPVAETVPEELADPILIQTPQAEFPPSPTVSASQADTFSQANTLVSNTLQASTATATATVGAAALNVIDRYDDADSRLDYDGDWVGESNIGNAYQRTLFVSNTIGNDLILSFVGQQIIIGYLGGPGLGSIAISIDDNDFQLDQSIGKEWVSPQFTNTEHFVIIVHESGNSVNLDYINILGSN